MEPIVVQRKRDYFPFAPRQQQRMDSCADGSDVHWMEIVSARERLGPLRPFFGIFYIPN